MSKAVKRLPRDHLTPAEVERAIAELEVERAHVFDRRGRQVAVFVGGDEWALVPLSARERNRVRDGLMIHNHPPRDEFAPADPRYDNASFSPLDWQVGVDLDLATLIVVSPTWRFTLIRPATGWQAVYAPDWYFLDMLHSTDDFLRIEDQRRVDQGTVSLSMAAADRSHRVNEQFAMEIGATYRRERR